MLPQGHFCSCNSVPFYSFICSCLFVYMRACVSACAHVHVCFCFSFVFVSFIPGFILHLVFPLVFFLPVVLEISWNIATTCELRGRTVSSLLSILDNKKGGERRKLTILSRRSHAVVVISLLHAFNRIKNIKMEYTVNQLTTLSFAVDTCLSLVPDIFVTGE